MKSPRARLALLLCLAAAALCTWLKHRTAAPTRPNVLLISVDTLRADRLGCYGGRVPTPGIDALARRGARFPVAVAHAPLTAPSHASLLTGLLPPRHGVRDNGAFVLPEAPVTLAQAFGRAGWRSAAFVSGFPLDRRFGFARGFEHFDDRLPRGADAGRAAHVERRGDATAEAFLTWLAGQPAGPQAAPWLAFVHFFDPHAPYEAPGDLAAARTGGAYEGEVAFVDAQVGRLAAALAARGESERTLVLLTSDHGESLGEHGERTHGVFVYDSTLRVPLLLAGPGVPPRRRRPWWHGAWTCCRRCSTWPGCPRWPTSTGAACARPSRGARWPTRRPTPSRSSVRGRWAGRRSSPGAAPRTSSCWRRRSSSSTWSATPPRGTTWPRARPAA